MADWPVDAFEFAEQSRVARLATSGADGAPHAVPICYVLDRACLHMVVDAKPKNAPTRMRRLRNIAENPRAAVIIDRYDDDWSRLEYVLLRGAAGIVTHAGDYEQAVDRLRAKYGQYREMPFSVEANPLVRVEIASVHHWRYRAG